MEVATTSDTTATRTTTITDGSSLKILPTAEALHLRGVAVDAETVVALAAALHDHQCTKRVAFVDCCGGEFVSMALTVVMNMESVESVTYQSVDLAECILLALGTSLGSSSPTLGLKLDVPFCPSSAIPIAKGLSDNITLESLDLSRCSFNGNSFDIMVGGLRKNKRLRYLKMEGCNLSDDQIFQLVSKAFLDHPKTFELHLDGNRCRSNGLNALAKLLQVRLGGLSKLSLSRQNVSEQDDFDVTSLAEALHKNTTLQHLDLSQNAPIDPNCHPIDAVKIALALPINATLTSLSLASNNLEDKDMKKIVMGLRENTALESVDLQNNLFTDVGAEILRKQGSKLRLKRLYLCGNRFGLDGVQIMTESIPDSIMIDF